MQNPTYKTPPADIGTPRQAKHAAFGFDLRGHADDATGREFIALYTRHARRIYAFIRAVISHQADAEDTFQDVSVVLWEKFAQFQRGTNFGAWATQVARYTILNFQQSKRRSAASFAEDFVDSIADEITQMDDLLEAQHRALADCYHRLSETERNLLDKRYGSGATVKDLSVQVGRPLRTVYRVIDLIHSRLLTCIERALQKEGFRA